MDIVMNLCKCCGSEIGNAPYCEICGLSRGCAVTEDESQLAESRAKDYIRKYFTGSIFIKCYTFELDNEILNLVNSEYVHICECNQYCVGQKIPLNMEFEPISSKLAMELDVRISKDNENYDHTISVIPSKVITKDKLCLEFTSGMKARFIIGDGTDIAVSDEFTIKV